MTFAQSGNRELEGDREVATEARTGGGRGERQGRWWERSEVSRAEDLDQGGTRPGGCRELSRHLLGRGWVAAVTKEREKHAMLLRFLASV